MARVADVMVDVLVKAGAALLWRPRRFEQLVSRFAATLASLTVPRRRCHFGPRFATQLIRLQREREVSIARMIEL
jgi:hypothetical protein